MALSEVSGFTQLSALSLETVSWLNDPTISPYLQGKLIFLDHYERWMNTISEIAEEESISAAVALRNLKKLAEDALRLTFASGCMVVVSSPALIDTHSYNHATKYFMGGPIKQFLRALRKTKTKIIELSRTRQRNQRCLLKAFLHHRIPSLLLPPTLSITKHHQL